LDDGGVQEDGVHGGGSDKCSVGWSTCSGGGWIAGGVWTG